MLLEVVWVSAEPSAYQLQVQYSTTRPHAMSTSLGWEDNHRSGFALAMCHRQQWFIHLQAQRPMLGR